eukprot:8625909-Lingulodinium_polyedra.AAC.1
MVSEMLRTNQIESLTTTGDTLIEFVQRLKSKLDNMALSCQLTQLDVTSIENALEASAPPG